MRLLTRYARSQLVKPGVAMTSNVKSSQQIFLGFHDVFYPSCIRRAGASKSRRLILLLSVGWLPPSVHPSGACLCLGTRILYKPLNAAEGCTKPGLRLFRCTLETFRVGG
jgi:hypothetical protein